MTHHRVAPAPTAADAAAQDKGTRPNVVRGILLLIWFGASFGVCWFARDLEQVVAGWPVNFWFAAQGAVLVFILVVMVYAGYMNGVERREHAAAARCEGEPDEHAPVR